VLHELLVGVALGVTASVPFRAAQAAGATLGKASGASGLGDGMGLFALALFGAAGGPLALARAWGETYVALPVDATRLGVAAGAKLLATAISLALPGLGALLGAELLGGLITRAQPLLAGGGALRVAVALLAIAAGVGAIVTILAGAGLAAPLG
jgi:type III secretory pathway component EscT